MYPDFNNHEFGNCANFSGEKVTAPQFRKCPYAYGKREVMRVNARNNEAITVNGLALEDVERFIYLGATVCKQGGGEEDIKARLGKARGVCEAKPSMDLPQCVKEDEDQAIQNIGQTSSHVWLRKMNESDAKKIDVFQNQCVRRIMKIKWQDKISHTELLKRSNVERLSEEIRRRRWQFIGHTLRQQPDNEAVLQP